MINGGFETDEGWWFPDTDYPAGYSTDQAHSGSRSMRVGIMDWNDNTYSYSSGWQMVTIPASVASARLRFCKYPTDPGPGGGCGGGDEPLQEGVPPRGDPRTMLLSADAQFVMILDENGNYLETLDWQSSNARVWMCKEYDLTHYAGRAIWLYFGVFNDGVDCAMGMYVDDVSLAACR